MVTDGAGYAERRVKGRYAVATNSCRLVDAHFGAVEKFEIYDTDGEDVVHIGSRTIQRFCGGPEDCDSTDRRMAAIMDVIGDCTGVIMLRIGRPPAIRLLRAGFRIHQDYDFIESAVKKAAEEDEAVENVN